MELQAFNYIDRGSLRVLEIKNEIWFLAADVCKVLDLSNTAEAVSRLDEDERATIILNEHGRDYPKIIVTESGFYNLVLGSRKPEAKAFKKWVTSVVLPTVRKNGIETFRLPKTYEEALEAHLEAVRQNRRLEEKILEQKADVDFATQIKGSVNALDFGQAAKVMKLGYGRNTLFDKCRKLGVLDKRNMPKQRFVESGFFEVIENTYTHTGTGQLMLRTQSTITGKGQAWLLKQLKAGGQA